MSTTNRSAETNVRYFGRCARCKAAWVRDIQTIGGNKLPVVFKADGKWEDIFNAACIGLIACECGGRIVKLQPLKASHSAKHECGTKCTSSKGPTCDCSCKGKNHGAGHVASAVA